MKRIFILVTFPSLPAPCAQHHAMTDASSIPYGIKRALQKILERPEVKGKHITNLQIAVSVFKVDKEVDKLLLEKHGP